MPETTELAHRPATSSMNESNSARICIPICVTHARDISKMIERAAEVADIIELRLDCLEQNEFEKAARAISAWLKGGRSFILTLRPLEQGGKRALDYVTRYAFHSSHQKLAAETFADIELDLALALKDDAHLDPSFDWSRIICSHHDFARVPADLEEIYTRMAATPARVLKIAVQADDAIDCLIVFQLLERARLEQREMIAIAMGEAGIATRILAPSRGAFLTYVALDEAHTTAPGQISAKDLRELYRVDQLNEQTQITGLIGSPVAHSVSPQMHDAAFAARGMNAVYIPFETRNAGEFMRRMIHPRTREIKWNVRGLSVTAPHKSAVMPHLDWIEPVAREIGAVNTIVVARDELHGYNTDAAAFLAPLKNRVSDLHNARCAILGAGGAARSALWSLKQACANVTLFARNQTRAGELAEKFDARCEQLADADLCGFDVVINTTPLGTRGTLENETPALANQLHGARLVYDLVYNPFETRFLREARIAGCEVIGGLSMLVHQAAAQFELWTNADAPFDVMREAAERKLSNPKF
ncbi:MAG: shikimate dehydrogenase [Pyrinomonadaceae bacterium]